MVGMIACLCVRVCFVFVVQDLNRGLPLDAAERREWIAPQKAHAKLDKGALRLSIPSFEKRYGWGRYRQNKGGTHLPRDHPHTHI